MLRFRLNTFATVALLLLATAGLALLSPAAIHSGVLAFDADRAVRLRNFAAELYDTALVQVFVLMLLIGIALEWLVPAKAERKSSAPLNTGYGAVMLLFAAALIPLQAQFLQMSAEHIGWRGLLDLGFDTSRSLPLAVCAMLIGAFVFDFFFYWFHRLQHSPLLWPQHLLHHSDTALNVTTTQRAHFLEHFLIPVFMTLPLVLLFRLPTTDVVWIAAIPAAWAYFVHMNVRIHFGRAWWLLTSPQYHRIHHSIEPRHFDRNFALWFPVWDVLFGTAYRPGAEEYPATGVVGVEVKTLDEAVILPFTEWRRMLSDRLRRLRETA